MPLFDNDPFARDDPFASPRMRPPPQAWRQPASPQETESTLDAIKNRGLSGLSYVLSSVDKPRRALAGALAGKPREMLSAIPFSDTLGITDPSQSTSGAELNKQYLGIKDDNSWKSWGAGLANEMLLDPLNLAMFGAKSALTAAGKAATKSDVLAPLVRQMTRAQKIKGFDTTEEVLRAAGHTPEQILHMGREGKQTIAPLGSGAKANEPLSGLMKIGLPFSDKGITLGTGRVGQAVGGALDKAGELAQKVPGVKTLNAAFDTAVGRAVSAAGQKSQRRVGQPAREAAAAQGRGLFAKTTADLQDLIEQGKTTGWSERDIHRAARMHAENVVPSEILPVDPALHAATQPIGQALNQYGKQWHAEARALGLPQADLTDDYIDYFFRQPTIKSPVGVQGQGGTLFTTRTGSNIGREKVLRDLPGGTVMINHWASNPDLSGAARALPDDAVVERLTSDMLRQAYAQGIPHSPELEQKLVEKAEGMSKYLKQLGPEHQNVISPATALAPNVIVPPKVTKTGVPVFQPEVAGDVTLRAARQGKTTSAAKAYYETGGQMARPMQAGMVPARKLLNREVGLRTYGTDAGIEGALPELHKAMARHGARPTEEVMQKGFNKGQQKALAAGASPEEAILAGQGAAKRALRRDLDRFGVTPEHLAEATRDYGRYSVPGELSHVVKGVDDITNFFRSMAYSAWLPSHVRNLMGGEVQTAAQTGISRMDPAMHRLRSGTMPAAEVARIHPGMPARLTDQEARRWLSGKMYEHGDVFSGVNQETDIVNNELLRRTGEGLTPLPPGSEAVPGVGEGAKAWGQSTKLLGRELLNPFKGIKSPVQKFFGPGAPWEQVGVAGGAANHPWLDYTRRLGTEVENRLRGSQYLDLVRQGYDPGEAGRRMLETHFAYSGPSGLTDFERNVMKRAVPFYTFARKNLPLQAETLMRNPRAIVPQLRVAAGGNREYLPEYLASGVAIPTGGEDATGNRQFISQLGIPVEEAFERFKVKPGDPIGSLRNMAMAYGAGLNPLIKGPLEQIFNRQFFSGRELSDLRPQGTIGHLGHFLDPDTRHPYLTQLAAQAVANSPMTRFMTAIDKLADPRKNLLTKAINLGTGVRISDVDMDKARAIESRKLIESMLRSDPAVSEHRELYVRPENAQSLTPDAIQNFQILSRLRANAQRATQERRRLELARQRV